MDDTPFFVFQHMQEIEDMKRIFTRLMASDNVFKIA